MMKKTVKRIGAAALAVCMMLSMMISASAVKKYYLELKITDKLEGITVEDTSASVSLTGDNLAETMVSIIAANIDGTTEENWKAQNGKDYGLYAFESVNMRTTIHYGLKAYEDGQWAEWVNKTYSNSGDFTDAGNLKELIVDLEKKVGALVEGKAYVMTYAPELPAAYASDPAYGNEYTFTLTLISKNVTTGGGGGGGAAPSTPTEYRVNVATVENATVKLSDNEAAKGDKVTVTVTPDEGYKADSVTVKTGAGAEVALTDNGDGTYTFTMPEGAITVTVSVVKEQTPVTPPPATSKIDSYTDIPADAWYRNAVAYVLDKGYMAGFSATEFGPDKTVTRAMVAQIFYNMENTPAVTSAKEFPDVAYGQWYYNAISWAAANGVVAGYGDGTYKPDKNVTREELAQMFFNYAKAKGLSSEEAADLSKFVDENDISDWAEKAVSWGVGAGLMSGKGGNIIDANGNGIRAEIAQMIMNFCQNIQA